MDGYRTNLVCSLLVVLSSVQVLAVGKSRQTSSLFQLSPTRLISPFHHPATIQPTIDEIPLRLTVYYSSTPLTVARFFQMD